MDTARIARKNGILNLYKSAFYLSLDAVKELCEVIDIFSISLKSIREDFFKKHATATLSPILENIRYVYQTGIHLELSNLMVTDLNVVHLLLKRVYQSEYSLSVMEELLPSFTIKSCRV